MELQEIKNSKQEMKERYRRHADRGRISTGIFLLIIGALFLARESGVLFPAWFFSWPVLLMGIGLYVGIKHRFQNWGWIFPFAIGAIFLADKISDQIYLRPYFWPILLIAGGLWFIFKPRGPRPYPFAQDGGDTATATTEGPVTGNDWKQWEKAIEDGQDVVGATAVFGGVKKSVLSKNFKGGEIVAVFGGVELNFTQSDFKGRVLIDCFNMFGGTKLIIPPDWEVQSSVVAIFGGVDDKRPPVANPAPDKIVYLHGTCIMGGVEIKSY
jgi:hypothetical protein